MYYGFGRRKTVHIIQMKQITNNNMQPNSTFPKHVQILLYYDVAV